MNANAFLNINHPYGINEQEETGFTPTPFGLVAVGAKITFGLPNCTNSSDWGVKAPLKASGFPLGKDTWYG